jgi:hypothetical protein
MPLSVATKYEVDQETLTLLKEYRRFVEGMATPTREHPFGEALENGRHILRKLAGMFSDSEGKSHDEPSMDRGRSVALELIEMFNPLQEMAGDLLHIIDNDIMPHVVVVEKEPDLEKLQKTRQK